MKAADSSCRTWMNRIRSFCFRRASKTPLMPSPGKPNTVSTPQASRRSTSMSDASVIFDLRDRLVLPSWTEGWTHVCSQGFDADTNDQYSTALEECASTHSAPLASKKPRGCDSWQVAENPKFQGDRRPERGRTRPVQPGDQELSNCGQASRTGGATLAHRRHCAKSGRAAGSCASPYRTTGRIGSQWPPSECDCSPDLRDRYH